MLLKNVLKTLRKKWMQLAAIGIIVVMSSLIYTMMFYGLTGITEPTLSYLHDYSQEDFSVEMFSTVTSQESHYPVLQNLLAKGIYNLEDIKKSEPGLFQQLIDSRIHEFNKVYPDTKLELREYKMLDFEYKGIDNRAFITTDAKSINLSYMEEGVKPSKDGEIALDKIYADKNSLSIGDSYVMDGKRYRITGYVLFPDYTFPSFEKNFFVDTGLLPLILMTDSEYNSVNAKESFRLSGKILDGSQIVTSFDKDKLPYVTQIIATADNLRSGLIYIKLAQWKGMALILSIFIASIAVVIVSIMMSNMLNSERGQIGILKAMGYRRLEIAAPYFLAVPLFAFIMLNIGYLFGSIIADPLRKLILNFYLLPEAPINHSFSVYATAIFTPLLFFTVFSGAVIFKMLAENPLELLRPHENASVNLLSRYLSRLLRKAKGKTKFKYLHAVRSTGSFVIFFLGIMFATMLMTYAFTLTGVIDRITVGYLNKVSYQYQSYADFTKLVPEAVGGEEKFLVFPYSYVKDNIVNLEGLSPDNRLYKLYSESGQDLTKFIKNDAVITKDLSLKLSIKVGDIIKIKVGNDYYSFNVKGITDDYSSNTVYLNISRLSRIISKNQSSYLFTGIYSTQKPSSEYYNIIVSKQASIDQSKAISNFVYFLINAMIVVSAVIATSILFVLTSFTVEKNYYSISLLKVLGYRRREVNSMVLNSYFVFALISYLVSVPIAVAIIGWMTDFFLKLYDIVLPLQYDPADSVIGLAVIVVIFLTGTYASRKKIERIALQEVLKTYGE